MLQEVLKVLWVAFAASCSLFNSSSLCFSHLFGFGVWALSYKCFCILYFFRAFQVPYYVNHQSNFLNFPSNIFIWEYIAFLDTWHISTSIGLCNWPSMECYHLQAGCGLWLLKYPSDLPKPQLAISPCYQHN